MQLRRYRASDAEACAALFHRAVQVGAAGHYSAEQRNAWAPEPPPAGPFGARLARQITWVAEEDGIAGFMSLRPEGYLDLTYVAPERRGTGLAAQLYDKIEAEAAALGLAEMTVEASLLARPFLARRGWELVAAQEVERRGVMIPNFRMRKRLGAG
ncbi:GNAT family N-acetyltransferase [Acidimangrovimonas sediminis]|uniref:GNAT family N-acetyltransferase n=1 Tax=Acidimangrovimonas sediminis TaxID=2056283 RepID=UPI001304D99B|nr:GNAT family N-acetyltransferase [Acidimangrovimonas sediminis]